MTATIRTIARQITDVTLGGRPRHMDLTDLHYVKSVLAWRVASCVCDGDLEPPQGARCRTRSGFRAWLRRAKRAMTSPPTTNPAND